MTSIGSRTLAMLARLAELAVLAALLDIVRELVRPSGLDALRAAGPGLVALLVLLYMPMIGAAFCCVTVAGAALRSITPGPLRPLASQPWILTSAIVAAVLGRRAVAAILTPNGMWVGPSRWVSWGAAGLAAAAVALMVVRLGSQSNAIRFHRPRNALALALLLGSGAIVAIRPLSEGWSPAPPPTSGLATPEVPDILLLTVDTLSWSHLGAYGYRRPTSPQMDRLAAEGVLFRRAYSVASFTTPSLISLFTGTYPTEHGVTGFYPLSRRSDSLPEALGRHGYQTAAMVGWANAAQRVAGLAPLFQQYYELPEEPLGSAVYRYLYQHTPRIDAFLPGGLLFRALSPYRDQARLDMFEADAETMTNTAVSWLRKAGPSPYFLWVHYIDPHYPYRPPERRRGLFTDDPTHAAYGFGRWEDAQEDDLPQLEAAYDEEIRYVDDEVGRLVSVARGGPRGRPLLLLVLADHGEHFSLPRPGHAPHLEEAVARIPLIVLDGQYPRHGVSDDLVQTLDLAPSILARLGHPPGTGMTGLPLATLAQDGQGVSRQQAWAISFEAQATDLTPHSRRQAAIWEGDWKLVQTLGSGERRLHNLSSDPEEQSNLAGEREPMEEHLGRALDDWLRSSRVALSAQDLERGAPRPPPGFDY